MGKYIKKSKMTGEVSVMEVSLSPQCTLGVRTRARTLALQRQQQHQQKPNPDESPFSYLELRSRRLEKPPLLKRTHQNQVSPPRTRGCCGENPSPNLGWLDSSFRVRSVDSGLGLGLGLAGSVAEEAMAFKGGETENGNDLGLEASFGENNFDFEGRDRSTRESTPCSLIRESDTLRTPGSTTRRRSSTETNQRVRNDMQRSIPTAHEMDEFFTFAEQQQQRIFIEKYNFDIMNDSPLPGRYEWVQVLP
ncbi:Cyclin-dependent kinase inhibitor [Parasponia andersonii]|uniref:Cyclin-dependent kinase inhibitor n=1 Tax=Parasponia andersonii TaxID=3476 RepID=A0A2P5DC01_PARAD|nr:Cyclin-dependent kinase inhibitor [Parasponia andersonii]